MKLPARAVSFLYAKLNAVSLKRPPDFYIGGMVSPYMKRWWIIPRNRFFNVYLHHFLRSDDDRALHDHPWWNVSLLLDGSYVEHTIAAGGVQLAKQYHQGELKFRGAKGAHRIELTTGPTWTLFITGPIVRAWGFHCPKGWRVWKDFVSSRDAGDIGRGCD